MSPHPTDGSRSPRSKHAYPLKLPMPQALTHKADVKHHEPESYARLLMLNQCYEAMPSSSKMVVFDTKLNLGKAFNGLIYQGTRHVLLSDAENPGVMTGILSVTDFIRVMLKLHREKKYNEKMNGGSSETVSENENLGQLTIECYRDLISREGKLIPLISIEADKSLLEAARLLSNHRIHRLPVLDPENGSPLFILTHKRLLKFLWCFGHQFSQPDYHVKTAKKLCVGTWVGIRVVYPDTLLSDCLDILLNKGVSGLPVVERNTFKVLDMYSRFDAIGIALADGPNSLDFPVSEAIKFKNALHNSKNEDRVVSVLETDTLWKAITVLVEKNVHRLCAVNERGEIAGIISLSDVLNHMVVAPGVSLNPQKPMRRHYSHKQGGDLSDSDLRSLLCESANLLEEEAYSGRNGSPQAMR
ncbi:unnamed protein product [Auanema sp. JU1783]|nr:unnamed protein product [Auanema sp. JU1783]